MPWVPSRWRCAQSTFFTPISTKALKWVQLSPLVTGHTQDTVTAPCPSADLAVRHWLYPPHCVPAGGEHTPWADQQGKPLFSVEDCKGGALRDTAEYPQWTGSLHLSRIYFKASANHARVRTIHSPPCSNSSLLKL